MLTLASETQLRIYATLRGLEARALAFDSLVESLKRSCVHGGIGAITELVTMAAELNFQLRQIHGLTAELDGHLGMLSSSDRKPARAPEAPEPPGIRGTTDVIAVSDLVGMLSNSNKTGTLALQSADAMFAFEFEEGRVVHAITNKQDAGLRLGTILVAQNKLTEEQLQASLDSSAEAKELLGAHLISTATVSQSDLRAALDVQVHRIFDQAFELRGARFTFLEGSISNIAERTALSTTHLLLEAARQKDHERHEGRNEWFDSTTKGTLDSILGG
jgi:hypothetical protein